MFPGYDVDAGSFRKISEGVTEQECANQTKRDINSGSAVLTGRGACYSKTSGPGAKVGNGDLNNLTLISCLDEIVAPESAPPSLGRPPPKDAGSLALTIGPSPK